MIVLIALRFSTWLNNWLDSSANENVDNFYSICESLCSPKKLNCDTAMIVSNLTEHFASISVNESPLSSTINAFTDQKRHKRIMSHKIQTCYVTIDIVWLSVTQKMIQNVIIFVFSKPYVYFDCRFILIQLCTFVCARLRHRRMENKIHPTKIPNANNRQCFFIHSNQSKRNQKNRQMLETMRIQKKTIHRINTNT